VVVFKDNGQVPAVPTVSQFIGIDISQDTPQGRQAVAISIISDLNNPTVFVPVDLVLNALLSFRDDFFPKVDASPFTQNQKNAIKQAFKDSALTAYNEIVP
jgi:hypothetical protein